MKLLKFREFTLWLNHCVLFFCECLKSISKHQIFNFWFPSIFFTESRGLVFFGVTWLDVISLFPKYLTYFTASRMFFISALWSLNIIEVTCGIFLTVKYLSWMHYLLMCALQLFNTSVICSIMIFGLVCWGESIEKQDRNKLNKNKKKQNQEGWLGEEGVGVLCWASS